MHEAVDYPPASHILTSLHADMRNDFVRMLLRKDSTGKQASNGICNTCIYRVSGIRRDRGQGYLIVMDG